jgi:hypothetical protein
VGRHKDEIDFPGGRILDNLARRADFQDHPGKCVGWRRVFQLNFALLHPLRRQNTTEE